MTKTLLQSASLLAGLVLAWPAAATPSPADTLKGQARLTRQLSADLCARLAQENKTQNLARLTTTEGAKLVRQLVSGVLGSHREELDAFLKQSPDQERAVGRQIGKDALQQLLSSCPVAVPLLTRLREAQPTAASPQRIDPEQQLLLRFIVPTACRYMEEENAKISLKKLTPVARQERMKKAALAAATPHAPALRGQYGEDVLTNPRQRDELSKKIISLMLSECRFSLTVPGEDDDLTPQLPDLPAPPAAKQPRAPDKP